MSSPLCSIIIPTFNHGHYIERSVKSALSQTLKDVEIIVIDDGSTDDTEEIVKQFGDKITYHCKINGGLGSARNKGIEMSSGKYLQFLDADDTIDKTKLEKQTAVLENDKSLTLVYSNCSCRDAEGVELENISYPLAEDENPLPVLFRRNLFGVHACLIKRSAVVDFGMFDESRVAQEDWDLWFRLAIKGEKFKYVADDLAHYDQTGSAMVTNPLLMYKRHRHMLNKYLNNADFLSLEKSQINDFIAHQSISLATRAYNNRWWKKARKHFLETAFANPNLMNLKYWACIPKTLIYQIADRLKGNKAAEPDNL